MIPTLDPCLFDLKARRVIYARCSCGHEACLVPAMLVGKHGIHWHTKVFFCETTWNASVAEAGPNACGDKWRD